MLAEDRGVAPNAGGSLLELDRVNRLTVMAGDRMLAVPDNSRSAHLQVVAYIFRRVDRRADRVEVAQNHEPFICRLRKEPVLELFVLFAKMRDAIGHRPEAWIIAQFRLAYCGDEALPFRIRHAGGEHVVVPRLIYEASVGDGARGSRAGADECLVRHNVRPPERQHRIEHIEADVLTLSGPLPREQRRRNRL